jgi:hypothetical protein
MGGADGYMLGKQEPAVPIDHLQHIDRDTLATSEGWTPTTDRWSDVDKFDTAYRRTFAKEILPEVYDVVAIGPQKVIQISQSRRLATRRTWMSLP